MRSQGEFKILSEDLPLTGAFNALRLFFFSLKAGCNLGARIEKVIQLEQFDLSQSVIYLTSIYSVLTICRGRYSKVKK